MNFPLDHFSRAQNGTQSNGDLAQNNQKVIAVTGGAGFIGSHLCESLVDAGHYVICLDNFYTGRKQNIHHLTKSDRFDWIEHDVTRPFKRSYPRFDEIYNLACPASPVHYQLNPVKTALTCAKGAMHVLERAVRDNAKVLQASTSEVYGDPHIHPQREDYFGNVNTVGPRSCYDEGKRFAEMLFTEYSFRSGIAVRIARIFNTYGPRMRPDDGRVVSNFVLQALRDEDITIFGDGSQTRSFCYVDDMVDGLQRLMNSGDEVFGPVNLGNPVETTVGGLAEMIISLVGSRSKLGYRPLPTDDPRRRRPDISKATKCLEWQPKVALVDGLLKTIQHFFVESTSSNPRDVGRQAAVSFLQ